MCYPGDLVSSVTWLPVMPDYAKRSTVKFTEEDNYWMWRRYADSFENHEAALMALLRAYRQDAENVGGDNF